MDLPHDHTHVHHVCQICGHQGESKAKALTEEDPHRRDNLERFKRLLREQIFLLKTHQGSAIGDFLSQKLSKWLDTQLRKLVNGPVKNAFAALHKALDEKEREVADNVMSEAGRYEQEIDASVDKVYAEMSHNDELIRRGETLLESKDVVALESEKSLQLLRDIRAAVEADNAIGRKFLSAYMGLSQRRVYMVGGVGRAIQRVFVAKDQTKGYDAYDSEFVAPSAVRTTIQVERLTFSKAFHISVQQVVSKWSSYEQKGGLITTNDTLREFVEDLADDVGDHTRNAPLLQQYTDAITSQYNHDGLRRGSEYTQPEEMNQIRDVCVDAMRTEFEDMLAAVPPVTVFDEIRGRLAQHEVRVSKRALSITWAMWIEKLIERGIRNHIHENSKAKGHSLFGDIAAVSGPKLITIEDEQPGL